MIYTIYEMTPLILSLIITFSVILFMVAGFCLYFFFFRKKKLTRQVKELVRRYEYLHSLLAAQDADYLNRIEYISHVNLLYSDIHEKHLSRYRYLKDEKDVYVNDKINRFKEAINSKHFAHLKKDINAFKHYMNDFESEVNKFNNDLLQLIHPEEECSHLLLEAKENLNLIKQTYEAHLSELRILKSSYTEVYKYIDNLIKQYEQYVELADYEEAMNLLPSLKKVLGELDQITKVMPELCHVTTHVVPQRITEVENQYKRLTSDGYPVDHIVTPKEITAMRTEIKAIIHDLKNFSYKVAKEKIDQISTLIDNYLISFNKEKESKKVFDEEFNPTYSRINDINKNFIKLCNSIPKVRKTYIINDEKVKMRTDIQGHINRISVAKRTLDNYLHAGVKQPYSVLLTKTLSLKKNAEEIENEMAEFSNYLKSLKEDTEKAYNLVSNFYYRVRKAEKIIRDTGISNFMDKYQSKIDDIYQHLEVINTTCLIIPIDVEKINSEVMYITYDGESILNQIEQDHNMLKLAESAILYTNQNRAKYPNLNALITQNEKMFYDGQFEKAYNETNNAIKRFSEMEKK